MAFHDDLLQQAVELVHKEPENPKQASLRRAVSTAYYALFHLLISEAVANWGEADFRAPLERAFDHATMKKASSAILNAKTFPFVGEDPAVIEKLRVVAQVFMELQEQRHEADYNNTIVWTRTNALSQVEKVGKAFTEWKLIRKARIAQAYLVWLLAKQRS
jgi:uncharacterized protein (UPF0332 family)